MKDRRKLILDQLVTLLPTLGLGELYRNRGDLSNDRRPFLTLHDGDETVALKQPAGARGVALMIDFRPEIAFMPELQQPLNTTIGDLTCAARFSILAAVLTDATLQSIVGTNGDVSLLSVETDLMIGKRMNGELVFRFSFTYPLLKADLT